MDNLNVKDMRTMKCCIGMTLLLWLLAGCRPSPASSAAASSPVTQEVRNAPCAENQCWPPTAGMQPFTQKQLNAIADLIYARYDTLTDASLKNNLTSWAVANDHICVTFILNTPEARKAFREKITDSPAVVFEGPAEGVINDYAGVGDTLGILLQSDCPVYSTQATQAAFTLVNQSNTPLECGDEYSVTYEDESGIWRELPINTVCFDVAYRVDVGGERHLSGHLYPEVHTNKPGRYRFFYEVTLLDTGTDLTLMAEFRLTDRPEELEKCPKTGTTLMPKTQDTRHLSPAEMSERTATEDKIYQVVEEMPVFPGGMKNLMAYIAKEMRYPKTAKEAGIQGCTAVQVVIEKDGTPTQARIVRHIHPELDAEALRIVKNMPKWQAGKQHGVPRRVLYTIPVAFRP